MALITAGYLLKPLQVFPEFSNEKNTAATAADSWDPKIPYREAVNFTKV